MFDDKRDYSETGGQTDTEANIETGRSFGELARHYCAHESRWHFAEEALLFAILLAISAWSILAAAGAVNELRFF
jgi:hypothetical protein